MPDQTRVVKPGPAERTVVTEQGTVLEVPAGWELLPPGDAGLTRRVKAAGPSWTVKEKRGRKTFSRGVWAPAERIARIRAELEAEPVNGGIRETAGGGCGAAGEEAGGIRGGLWCGGRAVSRFRTGV